MKDKSTDLEYIAKTFHGLEEVLAEELKEIGAKNIKLLRRAVAFSGTVETLYKANYQIRTALSILKNIDEFEVRTETELYDNVYKIDWYRYFDIGKTISVNVVLSDSNISHSHFAALKAKDAIVDKFRYQFGSRPDVDTKNPNIIVDILINKNRAILSLNSSGKPLFKRNYRQNVALAPLNEVLAAGLIKLSGWKADGDFIDPMCGSGTLPTEALMIAMKIPAQYYRSRADYCFTYWTDYDFTIWKRVVNSANANISEFEHRVIANDISKEHTDIAYENFKFAKLHKDIEIYNSDIIDLKPDLDKDAKGTIIINPPYGERIKSESLLDLYSKIGDSLKTNFPGFDAWVISSDVQAIKNIGLKTNARLEVFNGPLKCKFHNYNIVEGKMENQDE
jgi:putative N6-adenine-specific DNA methylase